jgi:hypothetical protein
VKTIRSLFQPVFVVGLLVLLLANTVFDQQSVGRCISVAPISMASAALDFRARSALESDQVWLAPSRDVISNSRSGWFRS